MNFYCLWNIVNVSNKNLENYNDVDGYQYNVPW